MATPQMPGFDLIKWIKGIELAIRQIHEKLNHVFDNTGLSVIDPGQIAQTGSIAVPSGGVLQVDGGDVKMLDTAPSATILFSLGTQVYGDRGITLNRNDGSVAFEVKKVFGAGDLSQVARILDRTGHTIAGDSILSFSGFDAPHIPMQFIPVDYTSNATAQTTSSATFVPLHEHRGFYQNPALLPQLMVKCSDGTTSAEIQFYDVVNAVYLGGYLGSPATHKITVPTGTTTFTLFTLPSAIQLPGAMSVAMNLQIHARRTAGAGSVSVAPVRMIGTGY